jgi:hypothetical protein
MSRFPLVILLLIMCAGIVRAQDDDPRMQQILHPDFSAANAMQSKTYYSGGTGSTEATKTANVKEFYISQLFSTKSFETKAFTSKGFWQGDMQFATKAANVKTDAEASKTYETKAAAVKDAHETGKGYDTKNYATRDADEKAKTSQSHLDELYKGKTQLNMDQVRDLLDKNY